MIYEVRTYTVMPFTQNDVEAEWVRTLPARTRHSPLLASFRTDFGTVNELVQVWPYQDEAERQRVLAVVAGDPACAQDLRQHVTNEQVEVVTPFPFSGDWMPAQQGPFYEWRQYTYRPGVLPDVIEHWHDSVPTRAALSPVVLLGHVQYGPSANSFVHIWPYTSMDQRTELRRQAAEAGIWPPAGGRENYLSMTSKLLTVAPFSPAQ